MKTIPVAKPILMVHKIPESAIIPAAYLRIGMSQCPGKPKFGGVGNLSQSPAFQWSSYRDSSTIPKASGLFVFDLTIIYEESQWCSIYPRMEDRSQFLACLCDY
jgi:hypothetical protein